MLKIPFGKDKVTGRLYDAGMVPNGKKCNCVCIECGTDLQAVHPKILGWQKYFRHDVQINCKGGLETIYHDAAKQIIKDANSLCIGNNEFMSYTSCDIEMPRHGKRPDAFISGSNSSLIVEVLVSHGIEKSTLDIYLQNGEKVLEIDISSEMHRLFNYERLKKLVLEEASRTLYKQETKDELAKQKQNKNAFPIAMLLVIFVFIASWLSRSKRYRR